MRPYQWVKNLLVFVPLVSAQRYDLSSLILCFKTFIIFSLISSSVYIINDIFDLKNDKKHPLKKNRPLASSLLTKKICISFSIFLFLLGIIFSIFENINLTKYICIYFILSFIYSYLLKRIYFIDILIISFLFLIRIIAGSVILNVQTSIYLLLFSQMFFFSLAGIKRFAEIKTLEKIKDTNLYGRPYSVKSQTVINILMFLSFTSSLLVLINYISSQNAKDIYHNSYVLFFMCPVLIIWFLRMYYKAKNFQIFGDPILFAMKDKLSIFLLIVSIVIVVISI